MMCGFPIFSFPFRQILLIEFRQKRFAIDIDIGIDSEIFIPVDISKLDDTGIIQQVGKTLFFKVSRFAFFRVSTSQFGSVDTTETDGDILSGNGRMLVYITTERIAVDDTQEARDFDIGITLFGLVRRTATQQEQAQ
ncbi:hypothetical protein C5Q97_10000 [Victivallales bacterium CCUG 44730]|nr:hypothetical protein C5Q97_10000 [Victivallales bacterium CCUG 44730]